MSSQGLTLSAEQTNRSLRATGTSPTRGHPQQVRRATHWCGVIGLKDICLWLSVIHPEELTRVLFDLLVFSHLDSRPEVLRVVLSGW